jgi:D-threo-aldose 1-dehydrogenase
MGLEHDAVQDIGYKGIRRCWEEGCELLGTYTAQMLSVHDPDEYLAAAADANDRKRRVDDIVAAYEALYELRMQGKAQSIGIGCKDWRIVRELDSLCRFDWVMFANSYTVMSHPEGLIRFMDSLAARGIAIINSAVLHGGFLSGGDFFDYKSMNPDDPADLQKLAWRALFQKVCQAHGVNPFHVSVAYGLSHAGIQSIALSTSRSDRVQGLVHAANTPIPLSVWKALIENGLIAEVPYQVTSSL